jgi:hypothetical protein
MGTTAPLRSANRWLRSTARRVGERVGYVAAMLGWLIRETVLHVARQPRIRGIVRGLLSHTPALRLRVKRLVMSTQWDRRSAWQQRTFGPPAVARMPQRVHPPLTKSMSRESSKGESSRFPVADSMQPVIDVEDVGARIQRLRR